MKIGGSWGSAVSEVSAGLSSNIHDTVQTSVLAEHAFQTGHALDLSQSEVLDHPPAHQAVLNRERGTLPEVYAALLD